MTVTDSQFQTPKLFPLYSFILRVKKIDSWEKEGKGHSPRVRGQKVIAGYYKK